MLSALDAANEKEAIENATERFEISPERHDRIMVQKMRKD
jgi:hypothetical protein